MLIKRFVLWSIIAAVLFPELHATASDTLTLTAGSRAGTYYPLAKAMAAIMCDHGIEVVAIPSKGSIENLERLASGSANLALVQSDILYRHYKESNAVKNQDCNYRPILSLYTETIQIVYRGDLSLKKLTDLRNKKISLGPKGSGTASNSRAILESAGLALGDIRPYYLSFEESIDSLRYDVIDVAFFTAGLPTRAIEELAETKRIKMLSLDSPTLQQILENCPYFVQTIIPSHTYKNFYKRVVTVGVKAVLIANSEVETIKIKELTNLIFAEKQRLIQAHAKAKEIRFITALDGIADLPLHLGAKAYYVDKGFFVRKKVYDTLRGSLPFLILFFVILMGFYKRREILRLCARHDLILAGFLIIPVWIICSAIIYAAEYKINEHFDSLPASLYSILVYLFSGFEDRIPITGLGRLVAAVSLIFGVGTVGLYTAALTSVLVRRRLLGGKMINAEKNNHIVICNWNKKGEQIVRELRSKDLEVIRPLLIIAKTNPELLEFLKEAPEKVYWREAEPTDFKVLEEEKICRAFSVIVLADGSLTERPDDKSAMVIASIKSLCAGGTRRDKSPLNICVEMVNQKNQDTLKKFGADEVVSSSYSAERLLAQSAISPGITSFFDDLLSVTPYSNEVYLVKCAEHFINHSFNDVKKGMSQLRDTTNPVVLVGVKTNGKLIVNPKKEEFKSFQSGDELLVIAWSGKGLDSIISKIKL